MNGTSQAVLRGAHKRIGVDDGSDLAFDLARDPAEVHPLPGGSLRIEAPVPEASELGEAPELSQGRRRALEALGYVDQP